MGDLAAPSPQATTARPALMRPKRFAAPDEFAPEFGVITNTDYRVDGLVKTQDVRGLLDAFGLSERKEVTFPFQHIKRDAREIWSMRIEAASYHSVDGKPELLHAWVYKLDQPEFVGAA